ncbi:MAG TPA: hypothetical protein VKE74_17505 [Gemmataceae bacterium]|nr:hypothetical protein [Gemmataceae bacterium]
MDRDRGDLVMSVMSRIVERFDFSAGRVDRSGPRPMIRGVLLCGPVSANRRRYRKEAFAGERIRRYADVSVYINHSDGRADRSYAEQIGWVRNPHNRSDGMPLGDIEVKPAHPCAGLLLDDAQHDPRAVGMSHVAHCQVRPTRDGWEDVFDINRIESVDLVLDPATVKGLFAEQRRRTGATRRRTIAELVKRAVEHRRAGPETVRTATVLSRALEQRDGEIEVGDDFAMPDDEDDSDGDIAANLIDGVLSAITSLVKRILHGGQDREAVMAKIGRLLDAYYAATGLSAESRRISWDDDDTPIIEVARRRTSGSRRTAAGSALIDWSDKPAPSGLNWD